MIINIEMLEASDGLWSALGKEVSWIARTIHNKTKTRLEVLKNEVR